MRMNAKVPSQQTRLRQTLSQGVTGFRLGALEERPHFHSQGTLEREKGNTKQLAMMVHVCSGGGGHLVLFKRQQCEEKSLSDAD